MEAPLTVLEEDPYEWTKERGKRLLRISLAWEALFAFVLLAVDTTSSLIQKSEIVALNAQVESAATRAKDAMNKAADAETRANNLLKENIDLERALRPREFNEGALASAVANLPRIPIAIIPMAREEPRDVAGWIFVALAQIKASSDSPPWNVTVLPADDRNEDGISIEYFDPYRDVWQDRSAETVAVAMCESLKSEGLVVETRQAFQSPGIHDWPNSIPTNG